VAEVDSGAATRNQRRLPAFRQPLFFFGVFFGKEQRMNSRGYKSEKRRKELAQQKKQEEKRQKRLTKKHGPSEGYVDADGNVVVVGEEVPAAEGSPAESDAAADPASETTKEASSDASTDAASDSQSAGTNGESSQS